MSDIKPPKQFLRFLRWFCHQDFSEELEGDLEESFFVNVKTHGVAYARKHYRLEVIKLFRPSVIKELNINSMHLFSVGIFKSNIKLAMRNLVRDRVNSSINILGLSIGFLSALFILLFVRHEMSVDSAFTHGDRIYRVVNDERPHRETGRYLATVGPPFAPALAMEYAEVESAVRLRDPEDVIFESQGQQFYENNGFYADEDFFKVFDFALKSGVAASALSEPNTIVLSSRLAQKYFGTEEVVGKTILLNGETELAVTGVLENSPQNSHLDFDFLMSFTTFKVPFGYPVTLESWGWISFQTYLMLRDGVDPVQFETKIAEFAKQRVFAEGPVRATYRLQPLQDIYFHSEELMNAEDFKSGSLTYIYGLLLIAFMILLVAGFNFMNISTARSVRRSGEVGVRKVLGAMRANLIGQFIGEAVFVSMLALAVALISFQLFGDSVFQYLDWSFEYTRSDYLKLLPALFGIAVVVGLLSSAYPALISAKFAPITALKKSLGSESHGTNVKKGLVVFQFAITVTLIISSLVVSRQMKFIQSKNLGYEKEQLVSLQLQSDDFLQRYEVARSVLGQNPHVSAITAGDVFNNDYGSVPMTPAGAEEGVAMNWLGGYFDYMSTLGIEMVEGRDFSSAHPIDTSTGIILNETAAKIFGWENPIGQQLQVNSNINGEVIGVARDFHYRSLHDPIQPLVITVPRTHMSNIILRLHPIEDLDVLVSSLKRDWEKIAPELPFQFAFIDDSVKATYEADQRFSRLIGFFSILAIIIAGMGLYGLIAIIATYREKEIGVRKVLGASVFNISIMLSRNFIILVLIANMIAIPLAWWGMDNWLQNFTYRTTVPISLMILAIVVSLGITGLALGYQVLKSALKNPVEALRSE